MNTSNDLNFILYGLISVSGKDTIKNIVLQLNKFIENMAIVTFQGTNHEKEDDVKDSFGKSLSFTEMERTREYKEGRYLLITTKVQLRRTKQETD